MFEYYLALGLSIVMTITSQVLLKKGADAGRRSSLIASFFQPNVLIGYGLLFLVTLATLFALRELPLMVMVLVYPLTQLGVLAASVVLFKEKISAKQAMGVGLILLGVSVFSIPG